MFYICNLKFLKLDLNKLPKCLLENIDMNLKPARNYEEKKYKVYKYVPVSKIQILLTKANRLNSIQEKCKMADPIYSYLEAEDEEGILRHTIFSAILALMLIVASFIETYVSTNAFMLTLNIL